MTCFALEQWFFTGGGHNRGARLPTETSIRSAGDTGLYVLSVV